MHASLWKRQCAEKIVCFEKLYNHLIRDNGSYLTLLSGSDVIQAGFENTRRPQQSQLKDMKKLTDFEVLLHFHA